ncbi:hypothetical protein KC357_g46 [Hortaea werneckii]|nr:hypothetical protein KC357_g46 [Hortaea werneckii]
MITRVRSFSASVECTFVALSCGRNNVERGFVHTVVRHVIDFTSRANLDYYMSIVGLSHYSRKESSSLLHSRWMMQAAR